MDQHLTSLALALGIFAVGFVSIGPNILAIIGTSMERGRRQGVALALGVGTGSGIWATLTVVGLTALVTAYAWTITALKILGAAYLVWLAYKGVSLRRHTALEIGSNCNPGQWTLLAWPADPDDQPESCAALDCDCRYRARGGRTGLGRRVVGRHHDGAIDCRAPGLRAPVLNRDGC